MKPSSVSPSSPLAEEPVLPEAEAPAPSLNLLAVLTEEPYLDL